MGGKKILITVSEDIHRALEKLADEQGLRTSTFVKAEVVKMARSAEPASEDRQRIYIDVTNYRELSGYVEQKHFGSIASFAMESVMQRNQLTEAQKARIGKSIN